MLVAIRNWFQDWSDACEYANECTPDLSFFTRDESNICLLLTIAIAIACWAMNEWWFEARKNTNAQTSVDDARHLASTTMASPPLYSDAATAVFVSGMTASAQMSGLQYLLFPELGALSNEVLRRPHGAWGNSPLLLIVTPFFAGVAGTLITQQFSYGLISIFAAIVIAILIIRLLGSPITPAISAGLLPLTLDDPSWWYPPSLLIGTSLLVGVAALRRRFFAPRSDSLESATDVGGHGKPGHSDYSWVPFFVAFLLLTAYAAKMTGMRFLLFPPLVVIAFEMFAHASACPWAQRPLKLPVVCGLMASVGVLIVEGLGTGAGAAALAVICGAILLRVFALHIPAALAVGLLPFVMPHADHHFSLAVVGGTALLSLSFLLWRMVFSRWPKLRLGF